MTRGKLLIGTFVAVVAAGVLPAGAQSRGAGSATREPSTSGERTGGSAVSRGGDSGPSSAGSPSSSGSSTSSGSGSSSSGDSGASGSAPSSPSTFVSSPSRGEYHVAPSHPSERQAARQRGEGDGRRPSGNSSGSGGRAVPRGGADSAPTGDTSRGVSASTGSDEAPSRRAVPAYSRPRDGNPQTGTAVDRQPGGGYGGAYPSPIYGGYYGSSYYYRSPYRLYYVPGAYGFGLGYFYDPLWYDPYAYGYGSGGYGYGGYGYGGGGYYGGSGQSGYDKGPTGAVRLKVKPREAQVFVDGFFVGDIDNFDGMFQKLDIDSGGHKIELRAEGYEPIQFELLVSAGETVTYKGELKRK
jgi:hypothetical protein